MSIQNSHIFRGLFPACPTLIHENETLDVEAQRKLYRMNADAGVSGFWMFGTGGEGLTLSDKTRRDALELLFDELGDEFPVIAGVSAEGTERTRERWAPIQDLPIDGIFATPPIYYGYSQRELINYFVSLVKMTKKPTFVYHNPFFTKNRLTIESLKELAQVDGIAGAKDSTNEIAETQRLLNETPEGFTLFQGNEELFATSIFIGLRATVSVVSASRPKLFIDIMDAAADGNIQRAMELQSEISAYLDDIGTTTARTEGEFIGAVKKRLHANGIGEGYLTKPWES